MLRRRVREIRTSPFVSIILGQWVGGPDLRGRQGREGGGVCSSSSSRAHRLDLSDRLTHGACESGVFRARRVMCPELAQGPVLHCIESLEPCKHRDARHDLEATNLYIGRHFQQRDDAKAKARLRAPHAEVAIAPAPGGLAQRVSVLPPLNPGPRGLEGPKQQQRQQGALCELHGSLLECIRCLGACAIAAMDRCRSRLRWDGWYICVFISQYVHTYGVHLAASKWVSGSSRRHESCGTSIR